MKRILIFLLATVICLTFAVPVLADVNADGGGGGMGSGSGESYWSVGDDGLRVSVVREKDNATIKIMDFSNKVQSNINSHFNYKNKIQYRGASKIIPNTAIPYVSKQPVKVLPQIISSAGTSNVAAIKQYFSDKGTINFISGQLGIPYDNLVSGDYVLMLEPIAYFTYYGKRFAMTATEAALFDQMTNGDLKYQMQSLTHQNLPLSLFLERSALGFSAWGGATSGIMANHDIKNYLGIATVVFDDDTEGDDVGGGLEDKDYVFRTDTDVIISTWIKAGINDITPYDKARVTFNVGGTKLSSSFVLPKGEKQLVWVKWHTPVAPTNISIGVSATHGTVEQGNITAAIVKLDEKTPPNPRGTDRNNGFSPSSIKQFGNDTSTSWDEWWATWEPKWEWETDWRYEDVTITIPDTWVNPKNKNQTSEIAVPGWTFVPEHEGTVKKWVDHGAWKDNGKWVFDYNRYYAQLYASAELTPDSHCPTPYKTVSGLWSIKSGYGWKANATTRVATNLSAAVTPVQNTVALFPEFNYRNYSRILQSAGAGLDKNFFFKPNPYSQYESPTHFTPIWYKDGNYSMAVAVFDVWTPTGQLYKSLSPSGVIQGDVYDDWHIGPYWED